MAEWQQTYDPRDLNYLSRNAKRIRDTASLLGVPALGHAAGRKPQFDDAGRSRARQRRDRQHERRPQSLVPVKSAARAAGTSRLAEHWCCKAIGATGLRSVGIKPC
jgi:hypothetical protein